MARAAGLTKSMVDQAVAATAGQVTPKGNAFHEGHAVVYPAHGVGRIDRIGTEEIAGHSLDVIQISFEENRMTLRIPLAKARAAGLRELASKDTLQEAFTILKGRSRVGRGPWGRRAQDFQAKINTGDPKAIAEVLRDLRRKPDASEASFSERQIVEAAMDRFATELAAVDRIEKPVALARISEVLRSGDTTAPEPVPEAEAE